MSYWERVWDAAIIAVVAFYLFIYQDSFGERSMSGHGHVYPNPDGSKARCGGPGLCMECSLEADRKKLEDLGAVPAPTPDLTPKEKEQKAYEQAQRMRALNKKLREMGVGIADPNEVAYKQQSDPAGAQDAGKLPKGYPGETGEGEELEKVGPTKFAETVGMPYDESVRTPFTQAMDRVRYLEAQLDAAQKRNANLLRDLDTLSVEHGKEMEKMRERLRVAEDALCKIAWRPLTDDFAYCINKKLWINDMEAETAREALARIRSGKDGGKKDA